MVRDGAICSAVSFKSLAEIPFGPDALLTSSERSADATSEGVMEISKRTSSPEAGNCVWVLIESLENIEEK